MNIYISCPSYHRCSRVTARAIAIEGDGTPSEADHLTVSVEDTEGSTQEVFVVYLPIDLARSYADAINKCNEPSQRLEQPDHPI